MDEIKITGMWKVGNKEFKGDLYIIKKKKVIRLILNVDLVNGIFQEDVIPDKNDIITGKSFIDNTNITLISCSSRRKNTMISYGKIVYIIDCKYCIYGLQFEKIDKVKFNQIQIRLTNSIGWSSLNGFTTKGKKFDENIEYKFKKKIEYDINRDMKLEVIPLYGRDMLKLNSEKIVLKQHVVFSVVSKRLKKMNDILEELKKVIALIEFCVREKIEIVEINGFCNNRNYKIPGKKKKILIKYRIYYANEVELDEVYNDFTKIDDYLICDLEQILKVDGLSKWFEKYDDLKSIIDIYRKNIRNFANYEDMPEDFFVNWVKALEFYHTRFVANSKNDFNNVIEKDLEKLPLEKDVICNFVNDDIQDNLDYVILRNRLVSLMIKRQIKSYFNNICEILNFVNSVVDTRHYYTHYNAKKKYKAMRDVELDISNAILQTLLESFILMELGFDSRFIDKYEDDSLKLFKRYELPSSEEKNVLTYKKVGLVTSIENVLRIIVKQLNLGKYLGYHIKKVDKDDDIYVEVLVDKSINLLVRILANNKSEEECEKIIKKDKAKLLIKTKKPFEVYYFYSKCKILIYSNK